jgi:hypothetical protein
VLDDIESHRRRIENLAPLGYPGLAQRQPLDTAIALSRQRMIHGFGRLRDLLERRSFVAGLTTDRLARRFAQRARLLGQSIGRRRLAGVLAVLGHLRFERVQTQIYDSLRPEECGPWALFGLTV